MQPPRTCCLCGKGFIDMPALWKHCEDEHHSWGEAVKRMLWEAEQLESEATRDAEALAQLNLAAHTATKRALRGETIARVRKAIEAFPG